MKELVLRVLNDNLSEIQFAYETGKKALTKAQKDTVRSLLAQMRDLSDHSVTIPRSLLEAFVTYYDENGHLITARPVDVRPLGGDYIEVDEHYAIFDQAAVMGYSAVKEDHWEFLFDVKALAQPLEVDPSKPLSSLLDVKGHIVEMEPQNIESDLFVNGLGHDQFYGRKSMTSRKDAAQVMFPNLRWGTEVVKIVLSTLNPEILPHIKSSVKDVFRNMLSSLPGHLHKIGHNYPPTLIDALAKLTLVDQRYVYYRSMIGRKDIVEVLGRWVPTYLFGDLFGEALAEATVPFSSYGDGLKTVTPKKPEWEPVGEFKDFRLQVKDFIINEVLDPKLMIPRTTNEESE
jgi:hypothetical protein